MSLTTNNQDDPPPYTPTPSFAAGESTLEHGPSRPFHSAATAQSPPRLQPQQHAITTPHQPPSVLRQITNSFNNLVNQLDQHSRSAYPERHQQPPRPPDRFDPLPSSPHPPPPSSFVSDFYAAGTNTQPAFAPPPVPPPPPTRQAQFTPIPVDGRPTSYPTAGHPLLHDGNVLVYPNGHNCYKCDNIGYKDADPSRPCRRCWRKYARPFSGPLAYSFSLNPGDGVFQRPLPLPVYRPFDLPGAFPPPIPPRPTGFSSPPPINHRAPGPPAAVVYNAGDPRIGGVLCWVCGGKGRINLILLNIDCEMCNGIGRTFQ